MVPPTTTTIMVTHPPMAMASTLHTTPIPKTLHMAFSPQWVTPHMALPPHSDSLPMLLPIGIHQLSVQPLAMPTCPCTYTISCKMFIFYTSQIQILYTHIHILHFKNHTKTQPKKIQSLDPQPTPRKLSEFKQGTCFAQTQGPSY